MDEDVSIVGGGVVGLSTGAWLELAGYETRIYTECRTDGLAPADAPPTVATPYAAASVVPHRDDVPRADAVLDVSYDVFRLLADASGWPVRQQRHVMVYERERGDCPDFADAMPGFRPLDADRDPVPTRDGVTTGEVDGWSFEPYFVSMPEYARELGELYRDAGGDVEGRRVSRDGLGDLPGDVVVNATGLGARHLLDDPALHPVRGHLLLVEGAAGPTWDGEPMSYNYYVPRPDGSEVPVYAYPREGELVLGGSKRPGEFVDGEWGGEEPVGPTITVDGVDVPARIVRVNDQLVDQLHAELVDESLDDVALSAEGLTAVVGYRPGRRGGARIERDDLDGTPVVHDYGHGGAGVTYSWGSAALVETLVADVVEPVSAEGRSRANVPADFVEYVAGSGGRSAIERT